MYTEIIELQGCSVSFKLSVESESLFECITSAFSNLICNRSKLFFIQTTTISIFSESDRTHIFLNDIFYLSCEKDNIEVVLSAIIDIISESFGCFPRGFSFYHAYVVAKDNNAILLIAPTHQGKTTIGTALTLSDWTYLSDDVAVFNEDMQLIPFPIPIKLRKTDLIDKAELSKRYKIIDTTNYNFLTSFETISTVHSLKRVVFLKRNCDMKDNISIVALNKFEALQRLILNAAYCSDLFSHTLASKKIVEICDSMIEVTYNKGLEVLKYITE